ncbi:MAG TPA: hypothetical protein VN039_04635 [Nitrospira sp.]|nr:hypothetical protein [Nitrospira sp.]
MDITKVVFSDHFKRQFRTKGFTIAQIREAIENPYKVTKVSRYPGQLRYCGGGVAVVMRDNHAITVYLDGVVTPLRDDQKNDPAALASRRLNEV